MASINEVLNKDGSTSWVVRWRTSAGKQRWQAEADPEMAAEVKRQVEEDRTLDQVELARRNINKEYANLLHATVEEAGEAFLDQVMTRSTRTIHEVRLRVHVYPHLGKRTLDSIRPMDIEALKKKWSGALSSKKGYWITLGALFSWADKNGLLTGRNPFSGDVKAPRGARKETPDAWAEKWVEGVINGIRADFSLAPLLGAFCGLRQGEMFGASPQDFVIKNGQRTLLVQRQVKIIGGHLHFAPPKHRVEDDDPREVPVPDFVWDAAMDYMKKRSPRSVTLPWDDPHTTSATDPRTYSLVFTTREGKATNRNYFNTKVWKLALDSAAIPSVRENGTHALRHWFACQALEGGVTITRLAYLLGHADPSFTLRVYGRFAQADHSEIASVMDRIGRKMMS